MLRYQKKKGLPMKEQATTDKEYKREYKKYLTASIFDSASNQIASSAFLTAFAVYLGLSNFAIGIYAVLNIITNIFQIFAAPLFYKIGQSKKVVLTNYTIYRLSSVCFAIIPFISSGIATRTALFFVFASIYALTGEMGYVTFVNWRMSLVRVDDRTKFSSTKNIFSNTVIVAFSLVVGVILDYFSANGKELIGFLIMFALLFIIALIDILIRMHTLKPELINKKVTVKDTITIPAKDNQFRKITLICALKCFAESIGMVYLNIFLLRQLHLGYIYYSILNLTIHLSAALFSKVWAKVARNRKWTHVLVPMSILYLTAFLLLFIIPNKPILYLLPLIYIMLGCASSAYNIFDNIAIYESAKDGYHTSYVTFERFVEGIVVAFIPLLTLFISEDSFWGIKSTFLIGVISFALLSFTLIITHNKKAPSDISDEQSKTDKDQ